MRAENSQGNIFGMVFQPADLMELTEQSIDIRFDFSSGLRN